MFGTSGYFYFKRVFAGKLYGIANYITPQTRIGRNYQGIIFIQLNIFKIGSIIGGTEAPRSFGDDYQTLDLTQHFPRARDYKTLSEYLKALERFAQGELS